MTDDLERRVRDELHGIPLPAAPGTLRAELERLPVDRPVVVHQQRGISAWLLGVVVAAMVILVGAIWVPGQFPRPAAASASPGPSSNGSPTPVHAGLIPWTDATQAPIASPSPVVVPPGTRTCGAGDLTASAGWQGATGQMAGEISVTNSSSTGCVIAGPPRQLRLLAGGTILDTAYASNVGTDPGAPVTTSVPPVYLKPGAQAAAFIVWDNWCGANGPAVTAVLLTLPGGGQPIRAGATSPGSGFTGSPRCDAPSKSSTVSAWAFAAIPPDQAASEQSLATVSLSTPPTATIGQPLDFTVTLTNTGTLPASLEPCPTYTEDLVVGGRALKPPAAQDYRLNCAAIGPQIAPRASVVLAMRYAIPPDVGPGVVELGWSMDPGGPFDSLSTSAHATLTLEVPVGASASSPVCAPSDMGLSTSIFGAALGTTYGPIHMALAGPRPCALSITAVAILDHDGQLLASSQARVTFDLTSSQNLRLGWASWCGPAPKQPLTVRLTLESGLSVSTALPADFGASCMDVPTAVFVELIPGP
jgi:hypothetical protein